MEIRYQQSNPVTLPCSRQPEASQTAIMSQLPQTTTRCYRVCSLTLQQGARVPVPHSPLVEDPGVFSPLPHKHGIKCPARGLSHYLLHGRRGYRISPWRTAPFVPPTCPPSRDEQCLDTQRRISSGRSPCQGSGDGENPLAGLTGGQRSAGMCW